MTLRQKHVAITLLIFGSIARAGDDYPFFPQPNYFRKYLARAVTSVELGPPVLLENYVVDSKLELSVKAYLNLVMANNPNVSIQKLTVALSDDAITRAFGMFDPLATASFSATRTLTGTTSAVNGATTLNSLSQPLNLGVQQLLPTGATYSVNYSDFKSSTNSAFATFNPSYSSGLIASFSQPLLRGRGSFITKLPITIARSRLKAAQYTFEDQVIQIVLAAEQQYWAVVGARENVRVAEEGLKLADTALKRARRELELGASSPLDIFQPEQSYANAQLSLTQARYGLEQNENALRMQMGADLDTKYREMPIVLTEPVTPPPAAAMDKDKLVQQAFQNRQDLKSARQSLDVDDLSIRQANDNLRPNLSLSGQFGSSGTGGPQYVLQNVFTGGAGVVTVVPGGITDALSQMFGFGLPTYGFGLTLSLPIKNRTAAANLADAAVNKKLDAFRLRSAEQGVRLQVLNAITNLDNSRASVELARTARDLAQKRVDAEQKKYELGIDTIFFLLTAETDLTTAESQLVNQTINYRLSELALLRSLGTLLEERGIAVQ
ncbi:MAG TPA: TolC family protein [Bryobacteraceae bacterium]|jgi:outer membrane protein|nr:TolC family protein [Bryobacteraceae bacterium]